ncbi:MAG: glycosyltransferase family 4 protein [Odoribacter sp.]
MKTKFKLIRVSTVPLSLDSLLKGQIKMLDEEYDVIALSSPGKQLIEVGKREVVRIIAVPMERKISIFKDLLSVALLIKIFLQEKPDIVHSITPKAGLLTMLAGFITGVPVRIHTFTGLIFPTSTGFKQKLLIAMDRLTCYCATKIIPEGNGVKQDLINYRITNKPLEIIANGNVNGIDLSHFDRNIEVQKQAKTWVDNSTFTFCFVGRLVKDKGINELIAAFKKLYNKYPNVRLILVGSFEPELDPVLPETEEAIHTHSSIQFVGFQKDIRPFLLASDALVFPSYREGFPNVVLQAGAMGLPSIVTDINGCNEIIHHGKNGVIIPPRNEESLLDAMSEFVSDKEKWAKMTSCSRQMIADRFDQKLVWSELKKMYKQQLENVQ